MSSGPPQPPPPPPPIGPGPFPAPSTPSATPPRRRDAKLVAAGVMSVLSGLLIGFFGAVLVWVTRNSSTSDDGFLDFDGLFRAVGVFFLIVAALYLLPGIGCALGRQWGRITAIVFNALVAGLGLLALGDGATVFGLLMIVWSGAIVLLAAMGRPTGRA